MADNKINVTVSANTRKNITVSSAQQSTEITASTDTGRFWAQTSKNWAVSDVIVDNTDFSSKHYAQEAKESAISAGGFETSTREIYDSFFETANNAVNELNATRDEAIVTINERFEEGLGEGANQIAELVNSSIAEYTEISNQIKQENSEASKLARDWATSEVLVDNLDYSAKYYAEKAKDNSGIFYDEIADEDIDVDILEQGYVSDLELKEALDTKQDKGDYALKEEIPSLEGYVKNTDYATGTTAGVVIASNAFAVNSVNGTLTSTVVSKSAYDNGKSTCFISKGTLENIKDDYVKRGVTTNTIQLTEDEKANAKQWLGFADGTDIMQAIASIPQFKLSIVEELPLAGEKMTLYLVSKGTESPDVYDEYIWIEETSSFEFLGTTAVDLTDYVKKTDYATDSTPGVVKVVGGNGIQITPSGTLATYAVLESMIDLKVDNNRPVTAKSVDYAVKSGITTNTIELTDEEKTSARTWLGAIGSTDYAGTDKHGVVRVTPTYGLQVDQKSGYLFGAEKTLQQYDQMAGYGVVSKSTLDNVLTQYSKTVSLTQADYEALETVDENTLYLIEE